MLASWVLISELHTAITGAGEERRSIGRENRLAGEPGFLDMEARGGFVVGELDEIGFFAGLEATPAVGDAARLVVPQFRERRRQSASQVGHAGQHPMFAVTE